ncbi:MAG: hypothetical protein GTO51_09815 [Candidatus Latescibacteria bacterium]|nr:hypothetical protein [Candidatus Latescibacterota bacterium]NIM22225.1 hypothetical protein [Candidatus Latescibacterota bacterium]NIM66264.1 hypothetical protein [Candidatus Latescibacterota bacterium]NIO02341.1 hypothetical protein [Candidatus Latescibacterota bacterium]NIO29872.1 hypothetical protein [Candidatus Latescibacterota bacterium]
MRRTLLIVAGLLLVASMAVAQTGKIQIFSDLGLTSCNFTDPGSGIVFVYIYHINTGGATGSQFRVEQVDGACMSYLAFQSPFSIVIGNPEDGIAIPYQVCLGALGPIELLTISYFACEGGSPPCSRLTITPDPVADPLEILVVDCQMPPNLLVAPGSDAWINDDGNCPCPQPDPIEDTSWGKIKSLYR